MPQAFVKDPDAILDYKVDWATWLGSDTISAVTWTVPTGITQTAVSNTTTAVTIWLRGGTVGTTYEVACKITTAGGRTDERTIEISVVQR